MAGSAEFNSASRPHIALVRPHDCGAVPPDAPVQDPLGVGYLAAILRRHQLEVVVLDAHALGLDDQGLIACLATLRPQVVGLSLHAFSDYTHCVKISRGLAAQPDRPLCIWGGEHATFHAERILRQHPEVDGVVVGEGEETLLELMRRHVNPRTLPPDVTPDTNRRVGLVGTHGSGDTQTLPIAGAVLRGAGGQVVHGGFRSSISDLDLLPEPHKDVIEAALALGRPVTVSVLTGRGCTHSCRFCTAHDFLRLGGGSVWRRRSPTRVVDELERLAATYLNHELVHPVVQFQDVIFLGTSRVARQWARDFVQEVGRRGLRVPFYCMTRADSIIANEELLPGLVKAGLWSVEMGIEAGVDRVLQSYNKLNASADNERAVKLLRAHGITYDASGYVMFDPSMSLAELRENALYLARFGAATWDFFVTRLQLYPGTALRAEMIERGLFDGEDDIGRTSGYTFVDARVGNVAAWAYYYDPSIRTLDLLLRDAKAMLAELVRCGGRTDGPLSDAVSLVHETYCRHLLALTDFAEAGTLDRRAPDLICLFLDRVHALTEVLQTLVLRYREMTRRASAVSVMGAAI